MSHHYWQELTATALIGVSRRSALPAAPTIAEQLATLVGRLDQADTSGALLGAAAATTLFLHAGAVPAAAPAPLGSYDGSDRPTCGVAAARHLAEMLGGNNRSALPEWLAAVAEQNLRVPDTMLPELLDHGRQHTELRSPIVAAIGARGRWLAELNPAWSYAAVGATPDETTDSPLTETWETSTRAARLHMLGELRTTAPSQARGLIESTWASEKADDRVAFIDTLAAGLSMDDEPFLEAALDDRSREVRVRATDLLARLPGSRLATRMAERAQKLLQRHRGWRTRIEVALPTECDKAMQRDGIAQKPPSGIGERAWWLQSILGLTPPSVWEAAWGARPSEIVETSMPDEWRLVVLRAWVTATIRYGEIAWAEPLLNLSLKEKDLEGRGLLNVLPIARREEVLLMLLKSHNRPLGTDHPAFEALRTHPGPWSVALSRAVLDKLRWRITSLDQRSASGEWHLRAALAEFAGRIPYELADDAARIWPPEQRGWPGWGAMIESFDDLLHFRREMHAALRERGPELRNR
jgi:hypothetical protein